MLRRDMHWGSSDDELTPPARTYARDYYYDSDEDTPAARKPRTTTAPTTAAAAASPRRASTPATAARARSSVPSSPASGGGEGARLCDEGDLIFAGVGAGAIRDPVAAFERYLEAATRHAHVPAMARVARCYASGEGAPLDLSESLAWLERGAAAEDADAVNLLGARREAGDPTRGESADESVAAALYRRAAELGSAEGARNHARALELGLGGAAPDPAGAAAGYEKAAAAGDADAQCARGARRQSGAADPNGAPDLAAAFRWFSAAAARGSAAGLNALAMMHEDGSVPGRAADPEEAKALYARAADKGHAHAHNNLGFVHAAAGEHEEAARRFRAAADRGDDDAMHNLGALHESGVGVRKDPREARRLYANAAERGHAKAAEALARLEASGALDVAGDGDGDGDGDAASASAVAASLRRQLAAKEKETSRLAKELGESKAECGRLKSTVADLRGAVREHEKEAARLRAEASRPASPATGARSSPARAAPEFTRSTSLTSNRSGYSNYSGLSGVSGQSGEGSGDGSPAATATVTANANANARRGPSRTVSGASSRGAAPSTKSGGGKSSGTSLSGVFGKLAMGGAKRAEKRAAEKETLKAHNREVSSVRRELEAATNRAELHEEMSATLSEVLRATYARNLQLEELLRKVGVDPDDPAIECELTPIVVETVAGYDVSQLDAGREGVGPGGELGTGAKRGNRERDGAADEPTGEGDAIAVAALPSPGSGDAR